MSIASRKTETSSEVKMRWESSAYKKYLVRLRVDDDADLIEFIAQNKDKIGTTELFRRGLDKLKSEGL